MKKLRIMAVAVAVAVAGVIGAGGAAYAATTDSAKTAEVKAQMLEKKKAVLDQRVVEGRFTVEEAEEIYNAIKENQASCDGTGSAGIGRKFGVGFGQGSGGGRGAGMRAGRGMGAGCGLNN
jgi:uncharacterized membrane protein YgcG